MARAMLPALAEQLGRPVVVENRPGAGGNLAAETVVRAQPDGLNLLMSFTSHTINASLYPQLPFDPVRDFTALTMVATSPSILVAHPSLKANTLNELLALARSQPGKLNFAIGGLGSSLHLAGDAFKMKAQVFIVNIPYRGTAPAIADVLAGQVQVFMTTPPSVMQHIQAGKLKALAVTGKKRHPGMPQVPTMAEAGYPNIDLEAWVALYAPAGTPTATVNQLADAVKRSLDLPESKQRADQAGIEVRFLAPADMTKLLDREIADWTQAIKAANIKLD